MALTPLHVRDVCYGPGWTQGSNLGCKYLDNVSRSDGQWVQVCTKLNPGAFTALEQKRKQGGWGANYTPKGDNCQGYLLLQYKKQGYDV